MPELRTRSLSPRPNKPKTHTIVIVNRASEKKALVARKEYKKLSHRDKLLLLEGKSDPEIAHSLALAQYPGWIPIAEDELETLYVCGIFMYIANK